MSNNSIFIGRMRIDNYNFKEILEKIEKYLEKVKSQKSKVKSDKLKPFVIFTPNPEIVVYEQQDDKFKEIINSAQINIPDGQGIIWASQFLDQPLKARIAGADLMEYLVKMAFDKGLTIGLIGGRQGIALRALECLRVGYPGLRGIVLDCPEFKIVDSIKYKAESIKGAGEKKLLNTKYLILNTGEKQPEETEQYFQSLVQEIKNKGINILFVGLGHPRQEYFIHQLSSINSHPIVFMAVGGSFDYLAKAVPRAPQIIRSMGLEWLFRLIIQPWRIRRQLSLLQFIWLVLKQKLKN